jgi:hypothetical protein
MRDYIRLKSPNGRTAVGDEKCGIWERNSYDLF